MADIKAKDVARLRKMTGAGMMDCKNALKEADGDFDKAVEFIRERGQAIANKRAGREATEGAVLAKVNDANNHGVVISLNCETDFVAKNDDFVKFAYSIADLALNNKVNSVDELNALTIDGKKVGDKIIEQSGVIGEKLELGFFKNIDAEKVVAYIHPGNKLATLVGFNQAGIDTQIGKDIAMQVAAMDPVAVDKEDVPAEVRDEEFKIGREQARLEGKPEQILDKIAEGRLNKFFKENTLMNQDFVKESKMTVRQYLANQDKDLKVTEFLRFTLNS